MNEENEREEYSGEMSAGAHREEREEARKREQFGKNLENEISKIFSEDVSVPPVESQRGGVPIPSKGGLPKQKEALQTPVPNQNEAKSVTETSKEEKEAKETKETKENKHGTAHYAMILAVLLLFAIVICAYAVSLGRSYAENEKPSVEEETEPFLDGTGKEKVVFVRQYDDDSGLLSLPELYEKYAPTVVSIRTQGANGSRVGSGFFLREDGYLATVAHVLEGAEQITVVTSEGTRFAASLVASNERTDLALLKIDGSGFPTVSFGASKDLLTGERVIAIGTPASLDYAGTLSTGEVSYRLRTVKFYDPSGQILQKKMKLLQTEAPLNPGNSGCPLFDEYGRVVGIVTMKLGSDYEGVGFAIPSDGASEILGSMMRGETLTEELLSAVSVGVPHLGVIGETGETDGIAGVRIVRFSSNPCDAAIKLREGDLIIGFDGETVATMEQMTSLIQAKNPGDGVLITVLRAGQRLTFEVILEKS